MVGTIATTHQQAAAFGAVAIIIMAAVGGLWVPMYLMAPVMQHFAVVSPLNWALNAYYNIFLRGGGFLEILGEAAKLSAFFLVTIIITTAFWRFKNPMNR
jgi:ABC-2 type transport system permease protein